MNKLEKVALISKRMEKFDICIEDIIAYRNNQAETKPSSALLPSDNKLPLKVLYTDCSCSFFAEKGKTPCAIMVGNIGFAFENAPKEMYWREANEYCKRYSIGERKWELPNESQLKALYENKDAINEVLKNFGKDYLKDFWYWAASSLERDLNSKCMYLSNGRIASYGKSCNESCVRPICNL